MTDDKPNLELSTDGGSIRFGDERLLLISATALGRLRRELIEVLGSIMAHELMFRFGFLDGAQAARTVRARMPEASARQILERGPLVHTMQGMARVRVDSVNFDEGDEVLEEMTGAWEDSYEADQVLEMLGPVSWTACWMLSGFASGYASEALERDLLCVEQACRARGDPTCLFAIHSAERYPGLAVKVNALREGLRLKERMQPTITRLREKAFTSSAFLARILQDSADAILTVDENEIIQTWNRGAEELLGHTADDVVGTHFQFLVPEDLRAQGEIEKIRRVTTEEGSLRNYETRRLRKDGAEVLVSLTRTSIYDSHGRYAGASAILRDVTERKRLVEQLIQAESLAEVGELAAQVAHEIKNPLAGISGAMQVLSDTVPADDPRSEVFAEVLDHIRRLDETVLSLLRFTKPYRPTRTPTDFSLIVDSALAMLEPSADFKDVRVRREIASDARTIDVDSQQFIQVVLNLLLNSAQAMDDGDRTITVRTELVGSDTLIEVEDGGLGMSPEVQRRIFKPFFTSRNKGNGLGLPIARKIVEGHGGSIRVTSKLGRGTTVSVRLPRG